MPTPNEDKLQKQFEAAKACLERMCTSDEGKRRGAVVSSAVSALADYRAYLSNLESAGEAATPCSGLRGQLSERAFDAEVQVRMLLAEGLNSLNDLRDSGMFQVNLAAFAEALDSGTIDFRQTAQESVKKVQELLDLPAAFADEMLGMMERRAVTVRYERETGSLVVRGNDLGNATRETRIRVAPQAGDMGRIGLQHFFSGEGGFSIQPEPPGGASSDCHRRTGEIQQPPSIDAYSAMVATMASAREAIYSHARKVSQYGHGTLLRAKDPVVAGLVVVGVALTVLIVAAVVGTVGPGGVGVGGPGGPTFITLFGMSITIAQAIGVIAVVGIILAFIYILVAA
jgi:hypothetical protein